MVGNSFESESFFLAVLDSKFTSEETKISTTDSTIVSLKILVLVTEGMFTLMIFSSKKGLQG